MNDAGHSKKTSEKGFDPARRRALKEVAAVGCGAALAGGALAAFVSQSRALPTQALRPPGALGEKDFASACVRCGLCVRACPYDILKLAEMGDGPAVGTPYFVARNIPCEMCEDIPCVTACPTGALDPELTNIEDSEMGVAVLTSRETCLNLKGLRCDVCYRVCPLLDKAITLERSHNTRTQRHAVFEPVVHADACTGCGKCEKACVLEEAAIKVLPISVAKTGADGHYRFGWKEKDKSGGALVPDVIDLPDRMPEAVK